MRKYNELYNVRMKASKKHLMLPYLPISDFLIGYVFFQPLSEKFDRVEYLVVYQYTVVYDVFITQDFFE